MAEQKIKKLTDYSHVRLKTEMYFGSRAVHTQTVMDYESGKPAPADMTWVPAVYTAFREIIDNALDEVVGHGHGNRIDVTYDPETREMSVEDNGRGIPISWDEDHQTYAATLALSEARAGRNFEARGEVAGTNGIGAAGVNFCSEYFKLTIHRDGKKFSQNFSEGNELLGEELVVSEAKIIEKKSDITGTKVVFKLSTKVFPDTTLPLQFVRSRITEIAIANPLIRVYFNGTQIKTKPRPEQSLFDKVKPIAVEIKEENFRTRFWLVPNWITDGEHFHTLVNNIPAFNGGVHIETFRRDFYRNLLGALEKESKRRKLSPNRSDVTEGVLIYNITNMHGPNFDSQSKTRLINEEVSKIVTKALDDPELYKDVIKKNKDWIEEIYKRCSERTMKKDQADINKLAKKLSRSKVAGLMDANAKDRTKCVLFLAEGDSAISGMSSVRNPEIHGGLALRGKVLNVNGEALKTVIENKALADIMNSVGLIVGRKANRDELRYGKVYIAHDMDPDGLNIGALLINFFHTFWPELFDPNLEPFINIFKTPFIIAEKGKQRKYWYSHNYQDFDPVAHSGWSITRAKGLSTLTEDDWQYSLDNPELFSVVDDGNIKDSLDLIFNNNRSDDRKEWIGM
jgi:DNA gyrase/topoisomerase IV subunit B